MNYILSCWEELFDDKNNNKCGKNSIVLFLIFFGVGCAVYFAKIVSDLPNPDAIWNGMFFKDGCGWEISLGRYMLGVLQIFRTYTVNTTFITLACMVILSFICIYVFKIFDIHIFGWKLIVGGMIIISPTVGSTLTYYYCSDFYILSYFLAVLAVWLMVGGNGKCKLIVSSICLMFSRAIYQAYFSLTILFCYMYIMKKLFDPKQDGKEIITKAARCLIGGIIGVGLYLISNKLVQEICKIDAAKSRGFSEMGIIHLESILEEIVQCYNSFKEYYFEDSMINNLCYFRREINIFFFALLGCLFLSVLLKNKIAFVRKLIFIIMTLFYPVISLNICILAPKTSIFDTTGVLMIPTMNYVYVFAVILLQQLSIRGFYYKMCNVGVFVAAVAAFIMLLQLELGGQTYMKHNMLKTYNVAHQMEARANQYGYKAKNLLVIGNMESGNYPETYLELAKSQQWVTASHRTIWEDYNGTQEGWHHFIYQYMGKYYGICSRDQYNDIIETSEYLDMKTFPQEGSVILINDTVVIKLSDPAWKES